MKTSIIIVNYNSRPVLQTCLSNIFSTTSPPWEIIIVDNNSGDDSLSYLATLEKKPQYKMVYNRENRGFAAACNQGIQIATGAHLVTMNPDILLPPNWLPRLAWHLRHNPRTLIVAPKGWGVGGKQGVGTINYPSCLAAANRKIVSLHHRQSETVKYLIGCFWFFDRRLPEQVGLFDVQMPLGADDFDLSLRVRQAGFQLRVARDVLIRHLVHYSFNHSGAAETAELNQSSWRHFENKWAKELSRFGWDHLFENENPALLGDSEA